MKLDHTANGRHRLEREDQSSGQDAGDQPVTLDDLARLLRGIQGTLAAAHAELLDAEAAAALVGISRASWDRMRSAGLVPAPVKLNGGTIIRWRRSELAKWIADGCPPCK